MKIKSIKPQLNCIVCKKHDSYFTNTKGIECWTFLKCNCGAELTLVQINEKNSKSIYFNNHHYDIIGFYFKNKTHSIIMDNKFTEYKKNNNYYINLDYFFKYNNIDKVISDINKQLIFKNEIKTSNWGF